MTFSNIEVAIDDLPSFTEIEFRELEPAYARLVLGIVLMVEGFLLLVGLLVWFLAIRPAAGPAGGYVAAIVFCVAMLVMVLNALYRYKAARAIGYAVREHDLLRRSGLFWQKEVVQPLRRVQHVELNRGPIEKRVGLASISLFSAGSGRATFTIPGLKLITAARLRRYVLRTERQRA
jgi:uncharacterized protein